MEDRSSGNCSSHALDYFSERMRGQNQQMMRVNGLIVANAILAGILVGVGTYMPRYRHRAFIRFLFQGATILFLPIVSYVSSNGATTDSNFSRVQSYNILGSDPTDPTDSDLTESDITEILWYSCSAAQHLRLVLLWAGLVQIVGINTYAIVAADDREGRNTGLPLVLIVQAIWTSYLVVNAPLPHVFYIRYGGKLLSLYTLSVEYALLLPGVYALIFARMIFKYYAFQKARSSFELGRSPRLIVGYMAQLQELSQHVGPTAEHLPPAFIVMGEESQQVEKQPHGYSFKRVPNQDDMTMMNNNGLVTIDKVWQLNDLLLTSIPQLKYVCFSFALFKLLRCRFARYTVAEAGFMKAHNFFWNVLLKDDDHERILGVITDELSFLRDYYYSSLPISYSKSWLSMLSIFFSLVTISYCLLAGMETGWLILRSWGGEQGQIFCFAWCRSNNEDTYPHDVKFFGNFYFDLVPVLLLLSLVVLAEVRDIASYICSNWTKVALICRYMVNNDTWQRSPHRQKWVGYLLRCNCKLMKHWDDKMNQCSVLMPRSRKIPIGLLMCLLHLPDQKKNVKVLTTVKATIIDALIHLSNQKKNVKVPAVVKAAIVDALRSSNGQLSNGATFLRRDLLQAGDNFLWACGGKGTANTILIWHIATSILEVRHPKPHPPTADYKVIASHLSHYCAYLVAYVPELLPDDDKWSKSLYKAVKKESMHVLAQGQSSIPAIVHAGGAEAEEYEKLVALLSERSEHEVLKDGVKLGKQLAELTEGEETAWRVLAGFWSEMILFVAPSDNLGKHAEAIARGGELITLVWVLLMHAGIATRPAH